MESLLILAVILGYIFIPKYIESVYADPVSWWDPDDEWLRSRHRPVPPPPDRNATLGYYAIGTMNPYFYHPPCTCCSAKG